MPCVITLAEQKFINGEHFLKLFNYETLYVPYSCKFYENIYFDKSTDVNMRQ